MTRSGRGLAEVLGEPRTRLGLGIGGLLATAELLLAGRTSQEQFARVTVAGGRQ